MFDYLCLCDVSLSNISNIEIIELTISDKSTNLCEINKKLEKHSKNGFVFDEINKLTGKNYSIP